MSVLKEHRTQSKAEFINKAINIEIYTIAFLSKMSIKFQKIFNEEVGKLVIQLVNHCEIANKHFPDSLENIEIRRIHLNQAKDCVNQIDIQMALIYDCLLKNPSGAFHSSDEKPLTASDAKIKLQRMAEILGNDLDEEIAIINGVLDSDRERKKKYM